MAKFMKAIFVLSLLLLFTNNAGAVAPSGSGSQEIKQAKTFIVHMWYNSSALPDQNDYPSSQLIFGVVATKAPFGRTSFLPAYTYSDTTYGNGTVNELQITPDGGATYEGRVQAVVKFSLTGVTLATLDSATLSFNVTDFHKTGSISTAMSVGVYDLLAVNKTTGTVVTTGTPYNLGTLIDTASVSFTSGQTFSVDVTAAVRSDLEAGRSFSGFILYPENLRDGLEEVSFSEPVLTINAIPTMTEWGMIAFALLLAAFAIWYMRRRKRVS